MSQSISARGPWRPTSVTFMATSALGLFMLFLGVRGLVAPLVAAKGFGLPVVDGGDAVWLQIKAGRDVCAGLSLVAFLALRNTRVMALFLLSSAAIPAIDMGVSLSAPVHDTVYALSVHGGAAALMLVIAVSLLAGAGTGSGRQ